MNYVHVYFAHRLGGGPNRSDNIVSAERIMSELADRLPIVPYGSWMTLARYWDESKREKGLAVDKEQIRRCDTLWLTGPELSTGMKFEAWWATEFRLPVFDFVGMSIDEIVKWWSSQGSPFGVRALEVPGGGEVSR